MPKADPKTHVRRERFRAYCRAHGWFDDATGNWRVTDIAAATFKPRNKVSDLLNGTGSFGAQIARELEIALGLAEYELEAVEPSVDEHQGTTMAKSKPSQGAPADAGRYVGDMVTMLGDFLQNLDDDGRDFVALALSKFAKNPKGERERVVGVLESAMRSVPPQPLDPKPTTKAARKSRASVKNSARPRLELKIGAGQKRMFVVPVPPLRKIMRDEDASPREQEWYRQLKAAPKATDKKRP